MSTEIFNQWSIILGGCSIGLSALTLAALLFYTYYTRQLLITSQAMTAAARSELVIMQEQLTVTQRASEATQKELEIMQSQLATAQTAIQIQQEREFRFARPVFVWTGGGTLDQNRQSVNFQNQGGPIAILETRSLNCSFLLTPANFISKDGRGVLGLNDSQSAAVKFIGIRYVTGMNEVQKVVFRIEAGHISPRVDYLTGFDSMPKMPDPSQPVDLIGEKATEKI